MRRRNNIGVPPGGFRTAEPAPGRLAAEKKDYQNEEYSFVWDEELVAQIQQTANRHQVTGLTCFRPFGVRCSANTTIQTMWCSAPSYQAVLQKSTA